MDTTIRPATLDDEAAVLRLLTQLFEPPGATPPGYTQERASRGFRWAIEQPRADVLLAEHNGAIVGLASVYADIQSIRYGPRCWLQDLVVDGGHRSTGIGGLLLHAAAEWARSHGCTHLELSSGAGRLDAHRFYERQGMLRSYNFQLWLTDEGG
jgi:GNAT superfamily N-acetyltransferase